MRKVSVRVKPGSKKGPLVEANENGELVVYVRERAVDGKANDAVIKILAKHFSVAKSQVAIAHGQQSRQKLIKITEV